MDHYFSGFTMAITRIFVLGFLISVVSGNAVLGLLDRRHALPTVAKGNAAIHTTSYFDKFMDEYLEKNHYTGATIGVARDNRLVYAQGYGTTTGGTSMDPTRLLQVSSISKTITAVAVMKLVQDGQLDLEDKVFGPGGLLSSLKPYPSEKEADHRLQKVTVEHLLHHTAGWSQQKHQIYDPLMNEVYLSRGHNVINISQEMGLTGSLTQKDVIQFMMGRKLDHAPGTTYDYSNLGYAILGQIIEEVSWMTYEKFVQDYILNPLGMWHTTLYPDAMQASVDEAYELSFHDGAIPLFGYAHTTRPSTDLIDSSLGWFSNVYDIMRLVTGVADNSFLSKESLAHLLTAPPSPMFEHQETWPGMGLRVSNTGAWWQVADPHDNEMIIYHQPAPVSQVRSHREHSLSWVLVMSSNNRKNPRSTFSEMLPTINWSSRNQFLDDCGMSGQDVANDADAVLMNARISEAQFPAYISALSRESYHPSWISTFSLHMETFMSVVSTRLSVGNKTTTVSGLLASELKTKVTEHSAQGKQLSFITSYSSESNNGHIVQTAIFSATDRTLASGFHKQLEHYSHILEKHEEQGYIPVVQSIASRNNKQTISFILEKLDGTNWKSYTNLTLQQLEGIVRSNARVDRTLHYLDSYEFEGELLFSAIFIEEGLHTWQFQATLSELEFENAAKTYLRLRYYPKIITGYEDNHELYFAVLWVKL